MRECDRCKSAADGKGGFSQAPRVRGQNPVLSELQVQHARVEMHNLSIKAGQVVSSMPGGGLEWVQ